MSAENKHLNDNSGRWTVVAMLGFGVLMVGLLWAYWEFYTRPFRDLQYAIAEEFPGSSPRVVGGRNKSHKNQSPLVLRVVARVPEDDFNPETTDDFNPEEEKERSEKWAIRLAELTEKYQNIDDYEILEIHVIQRVPEQKTRQFHKIHPVEEWHAILNSPSTDSE